MSLRARLQADQTTTTYLRCTERRGGSDNATAADNALAAHDRAIDAVEWRPDTEPPRSRSRTADDESVHSDLSPAAQKGLRKTPERDGED
ncbi:hypothetical protein C489_18836 [Natrinema versiforme JCM 10478]|uniref:Uncharacterized protein n=1 Tax=Natrinema versiforme JCM 10478 TaxID=1227496 RepID=L9XPR3_9EURY|nr:hypothetical protein C489_18836 [Natrinema versiforme JCM 10478]